MYYNTVALISGQIAVVAGCGGILASTLKYVNLAPQPMLALMTPESVTAWVPAVVAVVSAAIGLYATWRSKRA